MKVNNFIDEIISAPDFSDYIVTVKELSKRNGCYNEILHELEPGLIYALNQLGIRKFYSHQHNSIKEILSGNNTVVVTPTASGKTLVYNIPVLNAIIKNKNVRALYLFPLKALEQDQLLSLKKLTYLIDKENNIKISSEIYDGDTSSYSRKKIRESLPNIILSNPDMLHASILAYHETWSEFLKTLSYVVIDELHVYKGVFGSHILQVLRRFRRICNFYGSNPLFIACSATICNAMELTRNLTGLNFKIIDENGAPAAGKYFVFINPEVSLYGVAARLFRFCIDRGFRTIVFTKARLVTELIYNWTVESRDDLKSRVSAYRAGFLPAERRDIEKKLSSGVLKGVVSTSALEMGIDIGGLDICILVGYPGSMINTFQRSGRVGRGNNDSMVFLLAQRDALDQYFMQNPDEFFSRSFEHAVVDPKNPYILKNHLVCAAAELPLVEEDSFMDIKDSFTRKLLSDLEATHELLKSFDGNEWIAQRIRPQRFVNIRSSGETYTIFLEGTKEVIGFVGSGRVRAECHEGAVYLHQGKQYLVTDLEIENRNVFVKPVSLKYYTRVNTEKDTEILENISKKPVESFMLYLGKLKVTTKVTGYEKRHVFSQELISRHELQMEPEIFETIGFWVEVEQEFQNYITKQKQSFMGGIHAIEHALIGMFPFFTLCDRNDIGGISYASHPQTKKGTIFIYDHCPGGIGLSEKGFELILPLVEKTLNLVEKCSCEAGCPSCIHSPRCGSGNVPLDKQACIKILRFILSKESILKTDISGDELEPPVFSVDMAEENINAEIKEKKEKILILDLETQKSADEVGGFQKAYLMKVACVVTLDFFSDEFKVYLEKEIEALIKELKTSDLVIGFNIKGFDYKVLSAYTNLDFNKINTLDILQDVFKVLGYRQSLDSLSKNTLNRQKSASGLQSLEWFKAGHLDKVIAYCKEDVKLTKDLFSYGFEKGYLLSQKKSLEKLVRIPVDWNFKKLLPTVTSN